MLECLINICNRKLSTIDSEIFKQNQLGIAKRELVCKNDSGEIIESGSATSLQIRKKGLHDKFIGWIHKEL